MNPQGARSYSEALRQNGLELVSKRKTVFDRYTYNYNLLADEISHIDNLSENDINGALWRSGLVRADAQLISEIDSDINRAISDYGTYGTSYSEGAPIDPEFNPLAGLYSKSDIATTAAPARASLALPALALLAFYFLTRRFA